MLHVLPRSLQASGYDSDTRTDLANTQTPPPPREPTAPASSMDFCPHLDVITFAPQLLDLPPELQSVEKSAGVER